MSSFPNEFARVEKRSLTSRRRRRVSYDGKAYSNINISELRLRNIWFAGLFVTPTARK